MAPRTVNPARGRTGGSLAVARMAAPGADELPHGTGDLLERAAIIGWKGDFRRDDQVETAFDLVSAAGAQALGIADEGVEVGGAATLFTITASGIPEAVAAHPPRKLVLFDGRIVARDGAVLPA